MSPPYLRSVLCKKVVLPLPCAEPCEIAVNGSKLQLSPLNLRGFESFCELSSTQFRGVAKTIVEAVFDSKTEPQGKDYVQHDESNAYPVR